MVNNKKIIPLEGNRQRLDGGAMFGNCPRALWEQWVDVDQQGRIPLACRCLLIDEGDRKILLEAGIGASFEPKLAERYGVQQPNTHLLLESLAAQNLTPADIDIVILSHLHFDHVGGLLPDHDTRQQHGDSLIFPNATFITSKVAFERAQNPHARDRASFLPEIPALLQQSNRLELIAPGESPLGDSFEFLYSDGHTPGQLHTLYTGADKPVFFAGDLVPGMPWVHAPITMGYDRYPELQVDEKKRMLERAASECWQLFFTHDPNQAFATVSKNEKGRFVPSPS